MKPIDYRWLEDAAGYRFSSIVRDYLLAPVANYQYDPVEVNGERHEVLRVLTIDGDYHVFDKREGDDDVFINALSAYDIQVMRQLAGGE